MIRLDENFTIEGEKYNWILKFEENRTREDKNGKEVSYVSRDTWYYPKVSQALRRYKEEALKISDSVEELLQKVENLETVITETCN